MKMTTIKELFTHELQDLYSAEEQIIEVLPKLIEKATNKELKHALTLHLNHTRGHIREVDDIANELGIQKKGDICRGMQGVIAEGKEIINMIDDQDVRDAAIIMAAQRVEHYEIAGYGTFAAHARELGFDAVADQSVAILAQEYEADSNLTDIAESRINAEANDPEDRKLYA